MSGEIVFRDYRATDIEAMFQLDEACFAAEFRFDRRSMRIYAEEEGSISIIAEDSAEKIVGFVIVHLEAEGRTYVVTLDVAQEHRRKGVAALLMRHAEIRAAAAGAGSMGLHVFTGNHGAIRFYERMGYERSSLRRGFYGKAGMDAFVYCKKLIDL